MNQREKEIIEFALFVIDVTRENPNLWLQVLNAIDAHNGFVDMGEDEPMEIPDLLEIYQVVKYIASHPTRRRGQDDHRVGYGSLTELLTAFGEVLQK